MRSHTVLLGAGLCLVIALGAGAESIGEEELLAFDVFDPDGEAPPPEDAWNRVEELPYVGLRPRAPLWNRLGLFAEFRGTTLRLRGTLYDAAGGASLFLREHLALTGSYRVQGYDPVLQGARLGTALEGPFFSLSLRY
jgi:hypothetical protein